MNAYERLLQDAKDNDVNVYDFDLGGDGLSGIYIDGNVAIDTSIDTSIEKACVLAEELGHHHTSHGDILDLSDISNQKQELKARSYAYNQLIGLNGLIDAFNAGCRNKHSIAEHLEVTDKFLGDAIESYRKKYGVCKIYKDYVIMFIPNLIIGKLDI